MLVADAPSHQGRQRSDHRLDHARRDLRVELSAVDDATARALLTRHGPMVRGVVLRHMRAAQRTFHLLDQDTLVSIGQAALLEAHVRYREGDLSRETVDGAGFRCWARRVVGWRVSAAVQRHLEAEPPRTMRADSHNGALRTKEGSAIHPDEQAYHHELGRWLKRCLGRLELRERMIVALLLRGESKADVARSIGLSESRVGRLYERALGKMRTWAAEDGLDGLDGSEPGA